jgi:Xaa-Pro aminopeptidase
MKKLTSPRLMVNSSFDATDILYASGFAAVDPFLFLQAGDKKILVVSILELGRAVATGRGVQVLTPGELKLPKKMRRNLGGWAIGLLRHEKIRRVEVSAGFPLGMAEKIRRAGVRVKVSRHPPYPEREVKSADEIKRMQQSQAAAVHAMKMAVDLIRRAKVSRSGELMANGRRLTSEEVRQAIDVELMKHDCSARETIVACGTDSAQPHERGSGPLRANEPIVIDIFPQHRQHGYWGDLTRTIVKGRASDRIRNMFAAVKAAQNAALKKVRVGTRADKVHEEVEAVFKKHGFVTAVKDGVAEGFIHSTGHGVGLDVHEAPSISILPTPLKKGNVITIEPGLYYPDVGGVRMEDTVVVTSKGWEVLFPCKVPFEV